MCFVHWYIVYTLSSVLVEQVHVVETDWLESHDSSDAYPDNASKDC